MDYVTRHMAPIYQKLYNVTRSSHKYVFDGRVMSNIAYFRHNCEVFGPEI